MADIQGESLVPESIRDEEADQDSSLEEDAASSAWSLSSSIINYRHENGRTYHRYQDGKYSLPNDEPECERLDLQHHLFLLTFDNKLGLAPPNDPDFKASRVLDLGTGTGLWAIDYGDEHPEAHVIGIDLSPIQPNFVPPNVEFQVDDAEKDWTFSPRFDYIHSRLMTSSIENWPDYLRKIHENLNPGGFVELQEANLFPKSDDGTLKDDHELYKWSQLLYDASVKSGRAYQDIEQFEGMMIKAGFVDIVKTCFKWPMNTWPQDKKYKELGAWSRENVATGLEAFSMALLTRVHGWTRAEVTIFLSKVRKDLDNKAIHAYWPVCSIYGRKPEG